MRYRGDPAASAEGMYRPDELDAAPQNRVLCIVFVHCSESLPILPWYRTRRNLYGYNIIMKYCTVLVIIICRYWQSTAQRWLSELQKGAYRVDSRDTRDTTVVCAVVDRRPTDESCSEWERSVERGPTTRRTTGTERFVDRWSTGQTSRLSSRSRGRRQEGGLARLPRRLVSSSQILRAHGLCARHECEHIDRSAAKAACRSRRGRTTRRETVPRDLCERVSEYQTA